MNNCSAEFCDYGLGFEVPMARWKKTYQSVDQKIIDFNTFEADKQISVGSVLILADFENKTF